MTMTHKQALRRAYDAYCSGGLNWRQDFECALRAYIEARGLVLVPNGEWVTRESAIDAISHVEKFNGTGRATQAIAMLAAAPDPFTEE